MGTTNQHQPAAAFATAVLDRANIEQLYRRDASGGDATNDVFLDYLEAGRLVEDPDRNHLLVVDAGAATTDHTIARLRLAIRQRQNRRRTRGDSDATRLAEHLEGAARAEMHDIGDEADLLDSRNAAALLHTALAHLGELQRSCVVEFHLTGDSYEQIAHRHDISISNARQIARRGRAALAQELAQQPFFADKQEER